MKCLPASDNIQNTTSNLQNQTRPNWYQRLLWGMFLLQTKYKTRLVIYKNQTRPIYQNALVSYVLLQTKYKHTTSNWQKQNQTKLIQNASVRDAASDKIQNTTSNLLKQNQTNWSQRLLWNVCLLQTTYKSQLIIYKNQTRPKWSQRLLWVMFLLHTKYKTGLVIDYNQIKPIDPKGSCEIFVCFRQNTTHDW